METLETKEQRLIEALRTEGLRATPQRLVIYKALHHVRGHTTADEILTLVETQLPNVSLPTVYATLSLFENMGEIRRVNAPGDRAVYDTRTDHHHHTYCRSCGAVADLEAPVDANVAVNTASQTGFVPEWMDLTITGLCAKCAT